MIPRHVQIMLAVLLVAVLLLGGYLYRLERRTEANIRRASQAKVAPPLAAAAKQNVTFTIAYDEDGLFRREQTSVALPEEPQARARELLNALLARYEQDPSPHPLKAGGNVRTVFILADGLAVVDLDAAFADTHPSGIEVEDFTLLSMADTLAQNQPQITRVRFLIDGREQETLAGHADLLATYDAGEVHAAVESMR